MIHPCSFKENVIAANSKQLYLGLFKIHRLVMESYGIAMILEPHLSTVICTIIIQNPKGKKTGIVTNVAISRVREHPCDVRWIRLMCPFSSTFQRP